MYTAATLASIVEGVDSRPSGPVIDIGAGDGFLTELLVNQITNSAPMLAIDIDDFAKPLERGVRRLKANGANLPLRDQSVGLAATHFVLSRVHEIEATKIVHEISRVLVNGGQALILEPCLGMSTYHSMSNSYAGSLAAIARRTKARLQQHVGVNENIGLVCPALLQGAGLTITLTDLHIAKWFTAFPDIDPPDIEWLQRRAESLERQSSVDFMYAHTSRGGQLSDEISLIEDDGNQLLLTESGFLELREGRVGDIRRKLDDLERGVDSVGPVEFIPVVRVIAKKI